MVWKSINKFSEIKLDDHINHKPITDHERGEMFCGDCGLVLTDKIEDSSPEYHYTQEEYLTQTRTGPATSLTFHDKGLSTVIGKNKDFTGRTLSGKSKATFYRLRIWDQRSPSGSRNNNLKQALLELGRLKGKLALSDALIEEAAYLYRSISNKGLVKGRSITVMMGSALYAVCRDSGIPRTLNDIGEAINVKKKDLASSYRILVKELNLEMPVVDSVQYIARIASKLGISEKTKRYAIEILRNAKQNDISSGKLPMGMAATALYLSCFKMGEYHSQTDFARVANITEVTIRNRCKGLRKLLKISPTICVI